MNATNVASNAHAPHSLDEVREALEKLTLAQHQLWAMYASSGVHPKTKREWHIAIAAELVAHSRFIDLIRLTPTVEMCRPAEAAR